MRRRLSCMGLLALCILLDACVVVPVPIPLQESQAPFSAEAVAEILPGESTRADVLAKIGEPDYEFIRKRWWVVEGVRRSAGVGYIAVVGVQNAADIGYGELRESADFYLLLEFDAADRVTRTLEVNASEPCTADGDVCFRNGTLLATYTPDWDRASSHAECTMYLIPLYATGEPDRSWTVSEVSGAYVGYIGRGNNTGQAMRSILTSGLHSLVVISEGVGPKLVLRATFTCEAGQAVYMTVTNTASVRAKLNLVGTSDGLAALSGRVFSFVNEISE